MVRTLGSRSKEHVKHHVVDLFGKDYALGGVVELGELALEAFPLNATGKIMKTVLQERVVQYLQT